MRRGDGGPAGKRRRMPLGLVILLDALTLAVALNVFALFHHVLPKNMETEEPRRTSVIPVPSPALDSSAANAPTPVPTASRVEVTAVPAAEPAPAAEPERVETEPPAEEKTGWAKTFELHFTDRVVVTENGYSSPNVAVELHQGELETKNGRNVYYVADIYVTDVRSIRGYLAHDTYGRGIVQDPLEMAAESGAIAAVTGDVYAFQGASLMLRNGELYRDGIWQTYQTHCALFYDGTMVTYGPEELDLEQVMADGAWQIWSFGPVLLDNEGNIPASFDGGMAVSDPNPRSGIGYFEPGHYCFVVVDGRRPSYSYGVTYEEFASIFQSLGCKTAYNLDGGGSAVMTYLDGLVNQPSGGGRDLSDIITVVEPPAEEPVPAEEAAEAAEGAAEQ